MNAQVRIPHNACEVARMSTEDLLVEWGLWLHQQDSPVQGYTSPSLAVLNAHSVKMKRGLPGHTIDDETALQIDTAVAKLVKVHEQQGQGLVMYFSWRWSYRQIANRLGIDKNQVQQIIHRAVSWVDGYFHSQRKVEIFDCPDADR